MNRNRKTFKKTVAKSLAAAAIAGCLGTAGAGLTSVQAAEPVTTEVVNQTIRGDFGNGRDRIIKLHNADYDAVEVQKAVNEALGYMGESNITADVVANVLNGDAATETDDDLTNIAWSVIRGDYGNGADRKNALEAAGYDYRTVQDRVNELLGYTKSSSGNYGSAQGSGSTQGGATVTNGNAGNVNNASNVVSNASSETDDDLTAIAWRVIRGEFGNGAARFDALEAAGYVPCAVQDRVNELLGSTKRHCTNNTVKEDNSDTTKASEGTETPAKSVKDESTQTVTTKDESTQTETTKDESTQTGTSEDGSTQTGTVDEGTSTGRHWVVDVEGHYETQTVTERKWVPNVVTIVDEPEKTTEEWVDAYHDGRGFYFPSTGKAFKTEGEAWNYASELEDKLREEGKSEDEINDLTWYESGQWVTKTISPAVTHEEDHGHYEDVTEEKQVWIHEQGHWEGDEATQTETTKDESTQTGTSEDESTQTGTSEDGSTQTGTVDEGTSTDRHWVVDVEGHYETQTVTEQKWVPNVVTVVDEPEKTTDEWVDAYHDGRGFYFPSTGEAFKTEGEAWNYKSELEDKLREEGKSEDEINDLTWYESGQWVTKTISPAVTHEEDQGHYEDVTEEKQVWVDEQGHWED